MKDEIIQEVWQAKDKIAAKYQYSVAALVQHLHAQEQKSGKRVVDLHAQRAAAAK